MVKTVDNRGLPCPQPVLNTRRALAGIKGQSEGAALISIVDNEGAKENILRLIGSMGLWTAEAEQKENGIHILIRKSLFSGEPRDTPVEQQVEPPPCQVFESNQAPVFLITRSTLGSGNEELGKILMRSFIATIKEGPVLPAKMLFLNSGVYLTISGSQVLDDLLELEKSGVEIFSCGTCLDFFQLKAKVAVGKTTNMFDTVETLLRSARCITV